MPWRGGGPQGKPGRGQSGPKGLGWASLNNFSGPQSAGAVPRSLVPGPGAVRTGEQWPEVYEVTAGAGSGWVGWRL